MANVKLKNINKIYPNGYQAVHDFNIDIKNEEFIVLVGPSGCGKSTTLRMIAGLESITNGEFTIDEELMNNKAPAERNIAMVFQNYALYGHMTVYENIGFGLRVRKEKKEVIHEEVMKASKVVDLEEWLNRKPANLSGGQRQRVALGRTVVRDAKLFLMDEPLSNLDAKLRAQTRKEIRALHEDLKATTVYVTHDQIEAMTMADRIVIMDKGIVQQIGSPKEIYDNPVNTFVASFIGTPAMNLLEGKINEDGLFESEIGIIDIDNSNIVEKYRNEKLIVGIRPEFISNDISALNKFSKSKIKSEVDFVEMLGPTSNLYFKLGENHLIAKVDARNHTKMGDEVEIALDTSKLYFFDPKSTERIV